MSPVEKGDLPVKILVDWERFYQKLFYQLKAKPALTFRAGSPSISRTSGASTKLNLLCAANRKVAPKLKASKPSPVVFLPSYVTEGTRTPQVLYR